MIRKVLAEYRQLKEKHFLIQAAEFIAIVGLLLVVCYLAPAILVAVMLVVTALPALLGGYVTGVSSAEVSKNVFFYWFIGLFAATIPVVALAWVAAFVRVSWKKE